MKSENKLGDLLGAAIGRAGIMRQVGAAVVVQAGNDSLVELFDEGVLEFAQCRSFDEGRLSIACVHAALAQEIQMQSKELIELITGRVPGAEIDEVYVMHRSSAHRGANWHKDPYATS
ncbi:DUF721 domain-containing protein [Candidatus Uhrbacteria bacterium]|jgi:hypothetical protein|nr:DUF721 domain-containing protein [Candidatus Uhrbacteria bacterium]